MYPQVVLLSKSWDCLIHHHQGVHKAISCLHHHRWHLSPLHHVVSILLSFHPESSSRETYRTNGSWPWKGQGSCAGLPGRTDQYSKLSQISRECTFWLQSLLRDFRMTQTQGWTIGRHSSIIWEIPLCFSDRTRNSSSSLKSTWVCMFYYQSSPNLVSRIDW